MKDTTPPICIQDAIDKERRKAFQGIPLVPRAKKIHWHIQSFGKFMYKYKSIVAFIKVFNYLQAHFFPIAFVPTSSPEEAQIMLSFDSNSDKHHQRKAPYPFKGTIVAYTIQSHDKGVPSQIWLDENYDWMNVHHSENFQLLKMAIHQILHALAIPHSKVLGEIMYPNFIQNPSVLIKRDTIEAIRELYQDYLQQPQAVPVKNQEQDPVFDKMELTEQVVKKIYRTDRELANAGTNQIIRVGYLLGADVDRGYSDGKNLKAVKAIYA